MSMAIWKLLSKGLLLIGRNLLNFDYYDKFHMFLLADEAFLKVGFLAPWVILWPPESIITAKIHMKLILKHTDLA